MAEPEPVVEPKPDAPTPSAAWAPDSDDFLDLRGKAYLPARRRVQWLRGKPEAHPDWGIETVVVEHVRGERKSATRIEGGYAMVVAFLKDDKERTIATGTKTEYSENFPDYVEKAETGAIARALAVAGYGTEAALDFDEGRIADSPVDPTTGSIGSSLPTEEPPRKVVTGPSDVAVSRGGKNDGPSVIQIRGISEMSRKLGLGADGIADLLGELFGERPELGDDDKEKRLVSILAGMDAERVGRLLTHLHEMEEMEAE